ncbi:MAG: DUF1211 domain-containing protein [Fimbriimonadaceae bacterium]|nr:DUF1211 domain-containing protein [Chitinophagales bacterium]
MQEARHDSSKSNFQIDRITAFTDGVFAIAITLLVIEIRVPELHDKTDEALWDRLSEMALIFLGFIISFGIIGHYWSVHHRIFGYVNKYTSNLIWINLAFLLSVVLLPFSSGLFGVYGTYINMNIPYIIYVANMALVGLMNILLWGYVSKPSRKILTHEISPSRIRLGIYRSLVVPIILIISLLVSFILPVFARFIPFTIPLVLHYGMRRLERKADNDPLKTQTTNSTK